MKNETLDLIVKIVERAEKMALLKHDKLSLIMDLEAVNEEFNLRLEDFLNARVLDFVHDICGIQINLNRETKKIENHFIPRFSKKLNNNNQEIVL